MRILLTTVLCVLLVACSSSDPKPTATPTSVPATATAAPTQTPVVVVVTATPVPPPPAAATPVSAPQQSQPPVQPAAACTPASQVEIGAIAALILARTSAAPTPAEQAIIRQAQGLVDRNGDGQIDQGVCREAIAQATQILR